jgi:hypothetical protein
MGKNLKDRWLDEPDKDDYAAAESFLTLIYDEQSTGQFVKKLKKAEVVRFEAKDIFRASWLPLLGINDSHVKADQKRLVAGKKTFTSSSRKAGGQRQGYYCRRISSAVRRLFA